jgi:hypothetical protein
MKIFGDGWAHAGFPVPKGHAENRPTLQRWVEARNPLVPKGRLIELGAGVFNRPFGTRRRCPGDPNAEALVITLGYSTGRIQGGRVTLGGHRPHK